MTSLDIRRRVEDELGGRSHMTMSMPSASEHPSRGRGGVRALPGRCLPLRQGLARGSFEYSGIVFEEYRGRVGTVDFTDASKAYFFPVGVPGLFRQYNAPADFVETANTIGLPLPQAVDVTFAALGTHGSYPPASSESIPLRVIARRPDTIVGFGDTRIRAETASFEARASESPTRARRSAHRRRRDLHRPERARAARFWWSLNTRFA